MAFTDNCDIFGSFHEDGFNRIFNHIQHQKPSLFNYGTPDLVGREELYCRSIEAHNSVFDYGNPLIKVSPYLPIPGYSGPFGMSYIMQFMKVQIDFHPGNNIALPPELNPPLKEQHLSLSASFCAGMGCPDDKYIDRITIKEDRDDEKKDNERNIVRPPERGFPFRELKCFCLEVFAVLHIERSNGYLKMRLDGFEIVDIKPEGLENSLECYIETIIRLSLLPKVKIALNDFVFNIGNYVTILPTPISGTVPFNPSIDADKVSVFVNIN